MTPHLLLRLVDPVALVLSRVNSRWYGGALELRIDRTDVDPAAHSALLEAGIRTLVELVPLIAANRRLPVVRYYTECDIPGRKLWHMDVMPYQADIYLRQGLMPQELADELAGHYTNIACHLTK